LARPLSVRKAPPDQNRTSSFVFCGAVTRCRAYAD
jgi:hypothetical protein